MFRYPIPIAFIQNLIGAQVQPELALGCGEAVHHATIKHSLFSADVAEQIGWRIPLEFYVVHSVCRGRDMISVH